MTLWQTSTRRAALALLAAAIVVPTALGDNGRPVAGNSHLQELTAMGNSYRAQASSIAPTPAGYNPHLQELTAIGNSYRAQASSNTPAGYNSHLQELTAMGNSYRAQESRIAIASSASVAEPPSTTSSSFDWVDAGIGAMSGFGAAFAVAGTLLFVLRRRPRGQGTRTQTTA